MLFDFPLLITAETYFKLHTNTHTHTNRFKTITLKSNEFSIKLHTTHIK